MFFFFNDTATTEIYTLSLHDALPISIKVENLGGIAFQPDGKLLVTTNGAIKRYSIENDWKSFSISGGDPVVAASDLQAPKQIIEQDSEIYGTDWGTWH